MENRVQTGRIEPQSFLCPLCQREYQGRTPNGGYYHANSTASHASVCTTGNAKPLRAIGIQEPSLPPADHGWRNPYPVPSAPFEYPDQKGDPRWDEEANRREDGDLGKGEKEPATLN